MKIKAGNYDVFESGTVIGFDDTPIEFQLAPNMTIRFIFNSDESSKENIVKLDIIEGVMNITFINFNSSIGAGNVKPLPIGQINKRQLFLNYRIYSLADKKVGKSVHYTWYLGEEVQNG